MENLETTAVQTPASATGNESTETAPAGVENTDNQGTEAQGSVDKTIPYNRFKEVNDKMREYETQLKNYEVLKGYDTDTLRALHDFNQLINSKPEIYEQIEKVIEKYNKGEVLTGQPETQAQGDVDPIHSKIQHLEKQIENMNKAVTSQQVEKVMQQYDSEFDKMVKQDYQTQSEKILASHLTDLALKMNTPNYSKGFNKNALENAYKQSKELLSKFRAEILESVNKKQESISVPTIGAGIHGTEEFNPLDKEASLRFATKELERLRNLIP